MRPQSRGHSSSLRTHRVILFLIPIGTTLNRLPHIQAPSGNYPIHLPLQDVSNPLPSPSPPLRPTIYDLSGTISVISVVTDACSLLLGALVAAVLSIALLASMLSTELSERKETSRIEPTVM